MYSLGNTLFSALAHSLKNAVTVCYIIFSKIFTAFEKDNGTILLHRPLVTTVIFNKMYLAPC